QAHLEPVGGDGGHGERDAVYGHRSLLGDVTHQLRGRLDADHVPSVSGRAAEHGAHAVDVTLDDVPAEAVRRAYRAFQVHAITRLASPQGGAVERLAHDVDGEPVVVDVDDGEADAVDGDRRAMYGVAGREWATQSEAGVLLVAVQRDELAQFLHDSGEHRPHLLGAAVIRTSPPISVTSVMSSRSASAMVVTPASPSAAGP